MKVSPSRLATFGTCANQYKYQYILDLPGREVGALTYLGTAFHFALDVYEQYDYDIDLAVRTFRYYWNNPEDLGERIDWYPPRTSHEGLEEQGVTMLERYHEMAPWKGGELVATEVKFEVAIGDHTLRGVIDKLFWRPQANELQVIDYKTGVRVPKKLRYNLQFTAYLYAVTRPEFWAEVPGWEHFWRQAWNAKKIGQWYHARNNKMFNAGYRNDSDYRRLLLAIEQMDKAIQNDIFPLTIEGEACGWCSWRKDCGTEVDSPNQLILEQLMEETGERHIDMIASDK